MVFLAITADYAGSLIKRQANFTTAASAKPLDLATTLLILKQKWFQNPIYSASGGIAALPREAGFAPLLINR
jgi:hypothetical protein